MTIFSHALRRILSSKVKLMILLICPVLFTMMFVTSVQSAMVILVADNDGSALSRRLVKELSGLNKAVVMPMREDETNDRIISYQADVAIVIDRGFEDAIRNGRDPGVSEFHITEQENLYYARAFIDGFVADMRSLAAAAGGDRAAFDSAFAAYEEGRLRVESLPDAPGKANELTRGSMGFLVQFMLYMAVITAGVILDDRSSGVYYRVFFAPVSLRRYMLENLLAFLLVGTIQVAVVLAAVSVVFGMNLVNPAAMAALFLVFGLVCVALGMWLITLFRKPLLANLSILFLSTPLVMLGGCYWPSDYMPDAIVKVSKFFPTTWVMQAVDKVLDGGASVAGIGMELMVLVLFAAVFLAAGLVKKVDISK